MLAEEIDPRLQETEGMAVAHKRGKGLEDIGPVSYTHLDVYKRQEFGFIYFIDFDQTRARERTVQVMVIGE